MNRRIQIIWSIFLTAACAAIGPWVPSARAQAAGSRKDDVVLNARGLPLAGATIRVCTAAATGAPCSPLAQIYSNQAMTQALANPAVTDGMGNYSFYATPGRYVVEISGPGIVTRQLRDVILPSDPSTPTFASLTTTSGINAFSLTLAGNLTVAGSAAITGALTVGGGPVPSTGQANIWTASQTFKGPSPWRDVAAYGAKCDGSTDDTAAFNSAIADVTGSGAGGTVYIPWTPSFCKIAGTLNLANSSGNWLHIIQAGTIKVSNTITIHNFTQWIGIGGSGPTSFQRLAAAKIVSTGNIVTIHIPDGTVALNNLLVTPDGGQTTAHTILWDSGAANLTMNNVNVGANGTGDPFHADGFSAGGMFGLYMTDCLFQDNGSSANHASVYLRDIGIINMTRTYLGAYGIHYVFDVNSGGSANFVIDGVSLTEALGDDLLILESGGGNGITGVFMSHVTAADSTGPFYAIKAIGAGPGPIADVYLDGVLGPTDYLNPASTQHILGFWIRDSQGTTIPSGSFGSITNQGGIHYYAATTTNIALNIPRGAFTAGITQGQNQQDTYHFVDPVNGGNGFSVSIFTHPVMRFDSAASASNFLMESPLHGSMAIQHYDGGSFRQIIFGDTIPGIGFFAGSQSWVLFQSNSGNNNAGDFLTPRACLWNPGVSQGCLASTPTAFRVWTFPDASGTVAFTSQLPLSGTTSSIGGSSLAAGACASGTASVTNSTTAMAVAASPATDPGTGFTWNAWVSAAGTVTVRVCNVSGASATPTAAAYNVRAIQ